MKWFILLGILAILPVAYSYTPDTYTNIQTTLGGDYTPDNYQNIITILDGNATAPPTDSCTCQSINTNWAIALSDYCVISTPCDIGTGNITFTGNGNVTCQTSINSSKTDFGYILNSNLRTLIINGANCKWRKP